ncbi:MAG: hypothetical protein RQ875_02435 [Vicingaceae bacterium]|nr:hypothetical protein [Vicingaceae bacterium]
MTVDTSIVKMVLGNKDNPIAWFVTKNGVQTSFNTTVYCSAFDTTNFSINY